MSFTMNPMATTVAAGSFNIDTAGYIQGTALNDPVVRNYLAGGVLASTETLPIWGGVGLFENVPTPGVGMPNSTLGSSVGRAASIAALAGFSVFDQDHSMINFPQSPVPMAAAGMGVNFYRLGSGARLALAIDPILANLEGGPINGQVSWDFSLQRIIPYAPAYGNIAVTNATWANGLMTLTLASAPGLTVGDDFTLSGFVPNVLNGTWAAGPGTTGVTLTFYLATNPGTVTTEGMLVAGGGALPVKILDVQLNNSMTVQYSGGNATWNRMGSTAIALI